MTPLHPTLELLLEQATGRHRAGDFREARRLYGEILDAAPRHALALFRSALLELQERNPGRAIDLVELAAAADPELAGLDVARAQALSALGRYADAAAAYRRAVSADPDSSDLQFSLGLALQAAGRYVEAIDAYETALRCQPDHSAALNNLGTCQQRCGRFADAVASYQGALAREPQVSAHAVNLAIAFCGCRNFGAAAAVLRDLLVRDPSHAEAAFNLGNALRGLGLPREAAECYARAAASRRGYVDAFINLGNVHRELGELAAADAAYQAALGIEADSVVALNNRGCLLRLLGRLDEAEDLLRRGLELDPAHAALHDNLGSVLKDAGALDEAIECFQRSVNLDPGNSAAHSNLVYAMSFQSSSAAPVREACRRWGSRFADPLTDSARPHDNELSTSRRLRIGYVSPDFREHCQSLFTLPLLSNHDRTQFDILCYASVARPDDVTRRIASLVDVWRDVHTLDDAALASLIRNDGIDILVDLTLHMSNGRPLTFARKPAPVQIAWLAYPGSTGMRAMDYRLSDPRLDPPGFDAHYCERTVRLPDSFWCYDPLTQDPPVNPLPALARGHLTFGCLNNPCKLTDVTLRLWGGVMRALPDARIVLLAPEGRHRDRLSLRLTAHGVSADRVDYLAHRARASYLQAYHAIDLGLDTLPYNGHTTSLDALWMGVPTLSLAGDTCVGRGGSSQLFQLGLIGMAAATDAQFIETAVGLAQDLPRLARLRATLRARLTSSPLMDAPRFARHLEWVYRQLWRQYCAASGSSLGVLTP